MVFPEVKLLNHMLIPFLFFFEETRYCFHCGYILLNSHQQCTIFWFLYIFSNACYFLFLFICLVVWIAAIPVSMQYYLIAVLICISLMTSDDNLLFMNVLTISISSEKWLLSDYFWVKLFVLLPSVKNFLYILNINRLTDLWFANFSHSVELPFCSVDSVCW